MDEEPRLPVRLPVNQTTHRSTMVKLAIVIISIALLASFGWFLRSDWFWFSWDIAGAVLVSAGCIAEWILLYEDEDEHSERNKRLEKAWALVVAAGVTMDVFGLIYGIPEAIKLENRVEELRSNNLVLQARVLEVEKSQQDRDISQGQMDIFKTFLVNEPKKPVWVVNISPTRETELLAVKMRQMLDNAGYSAKGTGTEMLGFGGGYGGYGLYSLMGPLPLPAQKDVIGTLLISALDSANPPPEAIALAKAFKAANINMARMPAHERMVKKGEVVVTIQGK